MVCGFVLLRLCCWNRWSLYIINTHLCHWFLLKTDIAQNGYLDESESIRFYKYTFETKVAVPRRIKCKNKAFWKGQRNYIQLHMKISIWRFCNKQNVNANKLWYFNSSLDQSPRNHFLSTTSPLNILILSGSGNSATRVAAFSYSARLYMYMYSLPYLGGVLMFCWWFLCRIRRLIRVEFRF